MCVSQTRRLDTSPYVQPTSILLHITGGLVFILNERFNVSIKWNLGTCQRAFICVSLSFMFRLVVIQ